MPLGCPSQSTYLVHTTTQSPRPAVHQDIHTMYFTSQSSKQALPFPSQQNTWHNYIIGRMEAFHPPAGKRRDEKSNRHHSLSHRKKEVYVIYIRCSSIQLLAPLLLLRSAIFFISTKPPTKKRCPMVLSSPSNRRNYPNRTYACGLTPSRRPPAEQRMNGCQVFIISWPPPTHWKRPAEKKPPADACYGKGAPYFC